jgi:hypothetical protein
MKTCSTCKQSKLISEFCKNNEAKDELSYQCKECLKKYRTKRKEHIKIYQEKYYIKNKDRIIQYRQSEKGKEVELKAHLKKCYNLSLEKYVELKKVQNNKCAICNRTPKSGLTVDHCHKTKRVRGLLCIACNTGLGKFKEQKIFLEKAIKYLETN